MPGPYNRADMTAEEYLEFEESSSERHEYVDGQVFAMTGAREAHGIICGNIFAILHAYLRHSACRVFIADMKVRIESVNSFYYPDIMVSCEPYRPNDVYKKEPVLIVEVLSPSTQAIDRREKLVAYKRIASLKEYVLVHQRRYLIEMYMRVSGGTWKHAVFERPDKVKLSSLPDGSLDIPVETVYEKVPLPYVVKEDEAEYVWNAADRSYVLESDMSLVNPDPVTP